MIQFHKHKYSCVLVFYSNLTNEEISRSSSKKELHTYIWQAFEMSLLHNVVNIHRSWNCYIKICSKTFWDERRG